MAIKRPELVFKYTLILKLVLKSICNKWQPSGACEELCHHYEIFPSDMSKLFRLFTPVNWHKESAGQKNWEEYFSSKTHRHRPAVTLHWQLPAKQPECRYISSCSSLNCRIIFQSVSGMGPVRNTCVSEVELLFIQQLESKATLVVFDHAPHILYYDSYRLP